MKLRRISGFVLVSCLCLTPLAAWAQTTQAGTVAGVVRDNSGAVLPGVTVEAASPALIEKVRVATTDGQGLYRIVDLRPGVYTVTFTLPGFRTFRREGIELTTGFSATVNAELSVGAVEETITVTGEAPLVDTQNIRVQQQFSGETLQSLPGTGRLPALYTLVPAATIPTPTMYSVGAVNERVAANLIVHGAPAGAPVFDGMNGISAGLTQGVVVYNQLIFQEVVVETGGISADRDSGGTQINIVVKDGGNTFSGLAMFAYTDQDLESINIGDTLRARGVGATPGLKKFRDTGFTLGGPLVRDRLWFFGAFREGVTQQFQQGNWWNQAQGTFIAPGVVAYEPDLSRPAATNEYARDYTLRLTWQASEKHRIAAHSSIQPNCNCLFGLLTAGGFIRAPEATGQHHYNPNVMPVASWTFTATNRLLIEAGGSANIHHQTTKRIPGVTEEHIPILEQSTNTAYGARATSLAVGGTYSHNPRRIYQGRFAASYVTGAHNFKAGVNIRRYNEGNLEKQTITQLNRGGIDYTFRNGVPQFVRIWTVPHGFEESIRDASIYAQDQWTIGRATLNLGLRYDDVNAWTPEQVLNPGVFVDERRLAPEQNVPHFRNLDPRLGVAYDLFGNGRTALKGYLGRYADRLVSAAENPTRNMAANTRRSWRDTNRNLVPDCDLRNPVSNGECGPWSDLNFGQQRPGTRNAQDALEGFNDQFHNWQGSVSLYHELRPNVGLSVGYFRTWYSGFLVRDNLALTPADFDEFCITVPTDSRLPNSGQQLCGLYNIKPAKFGLTDNLVTQASNFGKPRQVYNGMDLILNARFANGGQAQGGLSVGRTVTDNCYQNDDLSLTAQGFQNAPDFESSANYPGFPGPGTLVARTSAYCRVVPPWSSETRFRGMVVYPLPWDLQASVIYQSLPGIPIGASYVASNAEVAQSLGRNLAGGARNVTVELLPPHTLFEDRLHQVDLRFTRFLRMGRYRLRGNLDVFNIFNASDLLRLNERYGSAWLNGLQVMGGRLVKVGAQFDF